MRLGVSKTENDHGDRTDLNFKVNSFHQINKLQQNEGGGGFKQDRDTVTCGDRATRNKGKVKLAEPCW